MRRWQVSRQAADVASHNPRDGAEFFEGGIALPPLHPADVAGRSIRRQREGFLGQPFDFSRLPNPFTQELERRRSFQSQEGRPKRIFPSSHYSGDFLLALFAPVWESPPNERSHLLRDGGFAGHISDWPCRKTATSGCRILSQESDKKCLVMRNKWR